MIQNTTKHENTKHTHKKIDDDNYFVETSDIDAACTMQTAVSDKNNKN